jgi:hypothetical protein
MRAVLMLDAYEAPHVQQRAKWQSAARVGRTL